MREHWLFGGSEAGPHRRSAAIEEPESGRSKGTGAALPEKGKVVRDEMACIAWKPWEGGRIPNVGRRPNKHPR